MAKTIRLAAPLQTDSIVDGEGIRTVVWTQGCAHNCLGCHNPETHSFNGGYLVSVDDVKKEMSELVNQQGITFSGGDPLYQVDAVLELAKYAQSIGLNVWLYTGFTYEELKVMMKRNAKLKELLLNVDALVDGKFLLEEKSFDVKFRGSKNQRIIDIRESINKGKLVLIEKYIYREPKYVSYRESNHLYI
ncbi:anaerobic ribonucleoside-triphosphate reductase-activating protein [Firmicutes bacterium CAG:884]|nr:anaerobic ribonucleoside-triphosphate reductase activating protein [Bacillota bacterium]CCY93859.1 anaerobic ribonucleoside-triphosphate reductase-activating protein [Firmicutes bacterium CAG:884]